MSTETLASDLQSGVRPKPLLLLIGSGARVFREYVIRSVSRHYRLWLLQRGEVTWQRPCLAGSTTVDDTSAERLVEAARALAGQIEIAGVFCYDERLISAAACVAEALGLPGMPPAVVAACRDKSVTRAALDARGVPQAMSALVATYAEARAAAEKIGYPVVLKPRGLFASHGVVRADDPDALNAGYRAARAEGYPGVPVHEAGVLVEEYLDGPEISVDSVLFAGECTPMIVARKRVGFDPFFEEVGHVVSASDPLLRDPELLRLLRDCHAALGIENGFTHTEVRLTARGPRIVEVNGRLGGDLIPYLGWLASGMEVPMAAADVAAGRAPRVARTRSKVAMIRFLYPREDCRVISLSVDQAAAPKGVHRVEAMVEPGAELRLPPRGYCSRYGLIITVGDTEEECLAPLPAAARMFELRSRPLDASEVTS